MLCILTSFRVLRSPKSWSKWFEMNKKRWKRLKKSISTSFRVRVAPKSCSKYTTPRLVKFVTNFLPISLYVIFFRNFLPPIDVLGLEWESNLSVTCWTSFHDVSHWNQPWRKSSHMSSSQRKCINANPVFWVLLSWGKVLGSLDLCLIARETTRLEEGLLLPCWL